MSAKTIYYYKAVSRDDVSRVGASMESPAVLMERLYEQGVKWAVAYRDGIEVGGIGCRGWWGSQS
jgi:hypothetical protein